MTPTTIDKLITVIAVEVLGLTTLATRRSDALDFHTLAVWQLRRALMLAFEAGQRSRRHAQPRTRRRTNA